MEISTGSAVFVNTFVEEFVDEFVDEISRLAAGRLAWVLLVSRVAESKSVGVLRALLRFSVNSEPLMSPAICNSGEEAEPWDVLPLVGTRGPLSESI